MRPPATATALAAGRPGSMVSTLALTSSRSGSYGMAQDPIPLLAPGPWAAPGADRTVDRGDSSWQVNPGSAISVCQGGSLRCDGWWPTVIDRAEAWDGDAVPTARNRPADSERGDAPSADSPAADDRPADAARTDAVLATPEQRATAQRRYRDKVDHTYDVARIDAGQEAASQESQEDSQSRGP